MITYWLIIRDILLTTYMNPLNRLGLRIAGLVAAIAIAGVVLYLGTSAIIQQFTETDEQPPLAAISPQPSPEAEDTDSDGLPDRYESIYRTDPARADTDGDGTTDLAEIEAGSDPTIAGPDDVSKPPTGQQVAGVQTYTQQYLATLPTDASREQILDEARLEAFITLNKGELLPVIPDDQLITTPEAGGAAIERYLNEISSSHNAAIHVVTNEAIEQALLQQLQLNEEPMTTIVVQLEQNVAALKKVAAPAEVVQLHRKLVAASQALLDNTRMLQSVDDDFVGGLIASHRIDDLGTVFQEIAQAVTALEQQYNLE